MKHFLKKIIRFILFLIGAALAAGLLINGIVLMQGGRFIRTMEDITTENGDWECILVLGCGVRADGTPSPMLRDRLDRAKELYDAGLADKVEALFVEEIAGAGAVRATLKKYLA